MILLLKIIYFKAIKLIFAITRTGIKITGKGDSNMRLKKSTTNVRDMTNEYGDTDPAAFPAVKSEWETASDAVEVIDSMGR